MSEENTQEFAEKANASNDIESLKATIEQLKSTNERLLGESQKYKTRKSEIEQLKEQLDGYKRAELEKKGDWEKRLEMEREARLQAENKLKQKDERILQSNVFNAVANYAKDAHDVNDLLAQSEFAKMIEVDEETLEPIAESVHQFVDALKDKKKYLFKGHKVASMADTNVGIEKPKPKTISQMSVSERQKVLKESIAALRKTK